MTRDPGALARHPGPQADKLSSRMAAFLLFTGPLAWFAQFCIGAWLASFPCYPHDRPLTHTLDGYAWTEPASIVVTLLCAVLAAASGWAARRKLHQVSDEKGGSHADLMEVGHGRTRFVALWGVVLGWSFAATILVPLVAFALVPRCAV